MFSLLPVLFGLFSAVAGLPQDSEPAFIKECVDAHNSIRSNVNPTATAMLHMSWDATLANTAAAWNIKCVKADNPHNPQTTITHPDFKEFGENIFQGTGGIDDHPVTQAVHEWAIEVKDYNFENNSCIPKKPCGHYTQVVWASSYKVGCARAFCDGWLRIICCYGPPGNYRGRKPYTAGSPCSNCPSTDTCKHNLCMNAKREELIGVPDLGALVWGKTQKTIVAGGALGQVNLFEESHHVDPS
ncbi:glioma pathogenesis-related protein 1-like [Discoglossus pictus]